MNKIKEIKCFLLDMDGTIYLGDKLIDGAKDFLDKLDDNGIEYIFLTNNSSKDKEAYVSKLLRLGIKAVGEDVFSSGDATIRYLKKNTNYKKIFLLGTPPLIRSFEREGFDVILEKEKEIDCVVLGFDTTLTYEKLWAACDYVKEVPYIATHPDFVCPLEDNKNMPDIGAMMAFINVATGKEPIIIGKPYEHILNAIMDVYKYKKEDLAVVGDRLYTDIKMGSNLGIKSFLVFSGETSIEEYKESDIKADYVMESVEDIIKYL